MPGRIPVSKNRRKMLLGKQPAVMLAASSGPVSLSKQDTATPPPSLVSQAATLDSEDSVLVATARPLLSFPTASAGRAKASAASSSVSSFVDSSNCLAPTTTIPSRVLAYAAIARLAPLRVLCFLRPLHHSPQALRVLIVLHQACFYFPSGPLPGLTYHTLDSHV